MEQEQETEVVIHRKASHHTPVVVLWWISTWGDRVSVYLCVAAHDRSLGDRSCQDGRLKAEAQLGHLILLLFHPGVHTGCTLVQGTDLILGAPLHYICRYPLQWVKRVLGDPMYQAPPARATHYWRDHTPSWQIFDSFLGANVKRRKLSFFCQMSGISCFDLNFWPNWERKQL